MASFTVTQNYTSDEDVFAEFRLKLVDISFDPSTYPAGGYTNARAIFGFAQILLSVQTVFDSSAPSAFPIVGYDVSTDTLRLYRQDAISGDFLQELATGAAISSHKLRILAIGK